MGHQRCAGCLGRKAEFACGLTGVGWSISAVLDAWGRKAEFACGLTGCVWAEAPRCRIDGFEEI